jgi:hypothetical protein
MASVHLLNTTSRRTEVMAMAGSTIEMRSFRLCVCGKTRITAGFPKRRSCTRWRNSPLNRLSWITSFQRRLTSMGINSAIERKWTMRNIPRLAAGRGMYFKTAP